MNKNKILSIDCTTMYQQAIYDWLSVEYDVILAFNANDGMAKYKKNKPNVVLFDTCVPADIEWHEWPLFLKEINTYTVEAFCIEISGHITPTGIINTLSLGVSDIILKHNLNGDKLMTRIGNVVKKKPCWDIENILHRISKKRITENVLINQKTYEIERPFFNQEVIDYILYGK